MGQLIVSRKPAMRAGKPCKNQTTASVVVITPAGELITFKLIEIRSPGVIAVGIDAPRDYQIHRQENLIHERSDRTA